MYLTYLTYNEHENAGDVTKAPKNMLNYSYQKLKLVAVSTPHHDEHKQQGRMIVALLDEYILYLQGFGFVLLHHGEFLLDLNGALKKTVTQPNGKPKPGIKHQAFIRSSEGDSKGHQLSIRVITTFKVGPESGS